MDESIVQGVCKDEERREGEGREREKRAREIIRKGKRGRGGKCMYMGGERRGKEGEIEGEEERREGREQAVTDLVSTL